MQRRLLLGSLVLVATGFAANCPTDRASAVRWSAQQAQALYEGDYSSDALSDVQARLDSCASSLQTIPGAATCLDPLKRFAKAQLLEFQDGHLLGTDLPDGDFLNSAPYPEMVTLPAELTEHDFLQSLDRNDRPSLDAAESRVAQVNAGIADPKMRWQVFQYVSQHLYTPDGTDTLGRFFVYVPGKDVDRYLQFGLQDDPQHSIPNSVSIVAIQKTDPRNHSSLLTPQMRAIDLWRVRHEDGNYSITTRYAVTHSLENCYGCHKSAVLPVTPDPRFFDDKRYGKTVSFVNSQMSRYGHVQVAGQDMKGYGPGFGPLSFPNRTAAFLAKCAKDVAPARQARIGDLMTCQRCHDGDTRGVLNYPSGSRSTAPYHRSLVEDYIVTHRQMPPGADDLSTTERQALFTCLKQEYYDGDGDQPGVLQRWLSGTDCWASR